MVVMMDDAVVARGGGDAREGCERARARVNKFMSRRARARGISREVAREVERARWVMGRDEAMRKSPRDFLKPERGTRVNGSRSRMTDDSARSFSRAYRREANTKRRN